MKPVVVEQQTTVHHVRRLSAPYHALHSNRLIAPVADCHAALPTLAYTRRLSAVSRYLPRVVLTKQGTREIVSDQVHVLS